MKKEYKYISKMPCLQLKSMLPQKIKEFSIKEKEFLYLDKGYNCFWIGIKKDDHAGYWYIANVIEDDGDTIITGKIEYDPDKFTIDSKMNLYSKIVTTIFISFVFIIFIAPILVLMLVKLIRTRNHPSKEKLLDVFMTSYLGCEKIDNK